MIRLHSVYYYTYFFIYMAIKRLFIETDVLHQSEFRSAQRKVSLVLDELCIPHTKEIFDEAVDFAWHEPEKVWEAVKRADEIYGDSSLVPLCGFGSYTGAPVVMDVMMQKAIDENITDKSLIFLRPFEEIEWDGIDYKLLPKAFKYNKLFTIELDTNYKIVQVDIKKLVQKLK